MHLFMLDPVRGNLSHFPLFNFYPACDVICDPLSNTVISVHFEKMNKVEHEKEYLNNYD
jgi:hypothetical protein